MEGLGGDGGDPSPRSGSWGAGGVGDGDWGRDAGTGNQVTRARTLAGQFE